MDLSSQTATGSNEASNTGGGPLGGSDRGIRVGRYTSPHFIDRWDCIVVNDVPVAEDAFKRVEAEVIGLAQQVEREFCNNDDNEAQSSTSKQSSTDADHGVKSNMVSKRDARPTQFEILTATAFKVFSDADPTSCDIAVIECGLGGQEDATNILPTSSKVVTIITAIGLDHLDILGGSLRSIVRAKCGILRESVPVIVDGGNTEEVLGMIKEEIHGRFGERWEASMVHYTRGDDLNSVLDEASRQDDKSTTTTTTSSSSRNLSNRFRHPRLQSLLPHQLSNLAIATKALEIIRVSNIVPSLQQHASTELTPTLLETILEDAAKSYPARLQLLSPGWLDNKKTSVDNVTKPHRKLSLLNDHTLLLDGAHNVQSALVLKQCIDRLVKDTGRPTIYILGLSSTKPPGEILQALFLSSTTTSTSPDSRGDPSIASSSSLPEETPDRSTNENNLHATAGDNDDQQHKNNDETPPSNTKIIFTSFSSVPSMPWVKCTSPSTLISAAHELGMSNAILGTTDGIAQALNLAEEYLGRHQSQTKTQIQGPAALEEERRTKDEEEKPLIVVAGSLYLASDFLRFLRGW